MRSKVEEKKPKQEKVEEKKPAEAVKKEEKEVKKTGGEKPEETGKKEESKKEEKEVKKTEAIVRSDNLPISTKYSVAICKFIKNKKIQDAVVDLEQVIALKKSIPMKGEIPHRKGRRMMSGRFPKKASQHFIVLLKSLAANANTNELEEPIIIEAIANIGSRPYGRFGTIRRKKTHIKIRVREKKEK